MVTWWGTVIECASAIARMERHYTLDAAEAEHAFERLREFRRSWAEVEAIDSVREQGIRLLRLHPLQATDSLQLAAAIVASRHRPRGMAFVCLDQRLAMAAQREGFPVFTGP